MYLFSPQNREGNLENVLHSIDGCRILILDRRIYIQNTKFVINFKLKYNINLNYEVANL